MKVFSATDIGQKRQMNQDYIYTSVEPVGNLPNLFVVADGMGGHNAGDFASRCSVSVLVDTVKKDKNFNPVKIIRSGIEEANREILAQSRQNETMAGMGTTMVAATVVGGLRLCSQCGRTAGCIWPREVLRQITQDHSLVAEMVRLGRTQPGREPGIIRIKISIKPAR